MCVCMSIIHKLTCGKAVTIAFAAKGVENKFDKIMFSSSTLCSLSTVTDFITVFPVPVQNNHIIITVVFKNLGGLKSSQPQP